MKRKEKKSKGKREIKRNYPKQFKKRKAFGFFSNK
jgi:hypothetical protein